MNKKIIQDFKKILKIPKKFDFSIRSRCQLCNYKSFKNFTNTSLLIIKIYLFIFLLISVLSVD